MSGWHSADWAVVLGYGLVAGLVTLALWVGFTLLVTGQDGHRHRWECNTTCCRCQRCGLTRCDFPGME